MSPFIFHGLTGDLEVNRPQKIKIGIENDFLSLTKQKLGLARYPEEQIDFGPQDWSQGAKVSAVKELAEYWQNTYDWSAQEELLNTIFNHYLVKVDVPGYGSLVLHFTHTASSRPGATPLLFSHGWPGSFVEASRVVRELTEPSGPDQQAFHLVAPSIPGFGFSPAPSVSGVGPEIVARAYKILMTDVLGYKWFVTQGGDFGSFITRSIALQYPAVVRAQHLNMFPVPPPKPFSAPRAYLRWCLSRIFYTPFEHEALRVRRNFEVDQSGYLEQQKTRPQTLGFALGDSPLGLLAWFVEKFHDWGDVEEAFTNDAIITLVMMHWIQGATPGLRFYREAFGSRREAEKTFEAYVACPTGVSMYAKEQLHCPKDWAQQAANVQFWKEYERGGHFSSLECPDNFVKDIREFFCSKSVKDSIEKVR
ncbi:putative epoxide hydrolase [Colletotrichum sp. SAR 10_70]|nr:putative epoxide hydrolase [Colletotrichum sp. SAR 10_71]KAI8198039.1 putative epoxide hydrolase [Colletotrichum sp. SAR 10_70]